MTVTSFIKQNLSFHPVLKYMKMYSLYFLH